MKELLDKMLERKKFLESQEKGLSFNPKERLGELQIWMIEIKNHMSNLPS